MNFTQEILRHARTMPDMPAVLGLRNAFTYRQLDHAISACATWLVRSGIRQGDVAGFTVGNPFEHVVLCLGLAHIGATQINIAPGTPVALQQSLAQRTRMVAIITSGGTPKPELGISHLHFELARLVHPAAPIDGNAFCLAPEAPFMLNTTSGTTGQPKIVPYEHFHVSRRLHCEPQSDIQPGDRVLPLTPVQFWVGKQLVFAALTRGATAVFVPPPELAQNFSAIIDRFSISHVRSAPILVHEILDRIPHSQTLQSIRVFGVGAARVEEALRRQVVEKITPNLVITYGSTETGIMTVALPPQLRLHPSTVGRPVSGVQLEIAGPDDVMLRPGEVGRIRLKSPWVPRGYFDDEAATTANFRNGWYYTGDLGAMTPDGCLIHHGRADDLMVFDGINIAPAEIENVLLQHPAVQAAVAFPIRSERHLDIPAAAVVLRSDVEVGIIGQFCRERLGVKAPRFISVYKEFPRNPNGKVLKAEIAANVARQLPPQR